MGLVILKENLWPGKFATYWDTKTQISLELNDVEFIDMGSIYIQSNVIKSGLQRAFIFQQYTRTAYTKKWFKYFS